MKIFQRNMGNNRKKIMVTADLRWKCLNKVTLKSTRSRPFPSLHHPPQNIILRRDGYLEPGSVVSESWREDTTSRKTGNFYSQNRTIKCKKGHARAKTSRIRSQRQRYVFR
jgi:hypothetical protein